MLQPPSVWVEGRKQREEDRGKKTEGRNKETQEENIRNQTINRCQNTQSLPNHTFIIFLDFELSV